MAIWGIGAYYENIGDVSTQFIQNNIVCIGHSYYTASAIHEMFKSISAGDLVYIKKNFPPGSDLTIMAIGIITSMDPYQIQLGFTHDVKWLWIGPAQIASPSDKNNVRKNTLYREYNPNIINTIFTLI